MMSLQSILIYCLCYMSTLTYHSSDKAKILWLKRKQPLLQVLDFDKNDNLIKVHVISQYAATDRIQN